MTLVLVNPHAQGGRARRLLPALQQAVGALTPFPRLMAPDSLDEALQILLREPAGARVVLVGGDGSFNRWLPALLSQPLTLGLVPLGSGNDLARALHLRRSNWRQALADAMQGRPGPVDTGLAVWTMTGAAVASMAAAIAWHLVRWAWRAPEQPVVLVALATAGWLVYRWERQTADTDPEVTP